MNLNSLAARLLAGAIALGAALPAPASAGGVYLEPNLRIEIEPVPAGEYYSGHRRPDYGHRRHHDRVRPRTCQPGEAIEKAHWMGLRRAGIHRVGHDVIVVAGVYYGDWARIVFDRWSPNCRIIAARGI